MFSSSVFCKQHTVTNVKAQALGCVGLSTLGGQGEVQSGDSCIIGRENHSSCPHDFVSSSACGEAALERAVLWVDISTGGLEVEMET